MEPTKGDSPQPKAKEKPQHDGRRGAVTFKIKPHTHQRLLEGTDKTLCARAPRERSGDPTRGGPDLPWGLRASCSSLLQGQGLRQQQSWDGWPVAQVLLEEVAMSPTVGPPGEQLTNWRTIIPKKFSLL